MVLVSYPERIIQGVNCRPGGELNATVVAPQGAQSAGLAREYGDLKPLDLVQGRDKGNQEPH